MTFKRKLGLGAIALALAAGLGGCFGDDGNDDEPVAGQGQPVPDSAGASVGAFIDYLMALSDSDESSEPSAISPGFEVPADETGEPRPLS